jgi:plasmid stabilization system protein ParE
VKVLFSPQARRDFEAIVTWWRSQRPAAPFLFEDEIRSAAQLLAEAPYTGVAGRDVRMKEVRRLVLRETRYLLYYRVLEKRQLVEVLRLWHTSRGAKPKL